MFTRQLRRALRFHPYTKSIFGGVYAWNRLPTRVPENRTVAFVVNTDPAHKPGQHWVVFYIKKDTIYYFDPYGIPPVRFHKIFCCRKNVKYFGQRLQGLGRMCGHYCIYFVLSTQTSHTFDIFGSDLNANDRIVKRFVEDNFCV